MRKMVFVLMVVVVSATAAVAKLHTETVEYRHGEVVLEGYLAYDDTIKAPRPGVLIVHEWKGLGSYAKARAEQLARLGYVAFALDMYGKGIRPMTSEEASAEAGKYYKDVPLMRARAQSGLDILKTQQLVDSSRTAVIGYCFGGKTALELARSGARVAGVVSFHGTLSTPNPDDAKNIRGKVLVCHGGADPYVPADQVKAFEDEMATGNVDWQVNVYGGAVHSFTNPESGNDQTTGAAYNANADKRSWQAMLSFFDEIFD